MNEIQKLLNIYIFSPLLSILIALFFILRKQTAWQHILRAASGNSSWKLTHFQENRVVDGLFSAESDVVSLL